MIIQNQPIQLYEGKWQKSKKTKWTDLSTEKTIANQIAKNQELDQLARQAQRNAKKAEVEGGLETINCLSSAWASEKWWTTSHPSIVVPTGRKVRREQTSV